MKDKLVYLTADQIRTLEDWCHMGLRHKISRKVTVRKSGKTFNYTVTYQFEKSGKIGMFSEKDGGATGWLGYLLLPDKYEGGVTRAHFRVFDPEHCYLYSSNISDFKKIWNQLNNPTSSYIVWGYYG